MSLYRAIYEWPDGRRAWVSFSSAPRDALRWAAAYVRAFTGGYLLALEEMRGMQSHFTLEA